MKNLKLFVLFLAIAGVVASSCNKTKKDSGYPLFWTWMDYRPGMNFDSICSIMNETGIDGVMLNAPTPDD
jgi:hypothetical protein